MQEWVINVMGNYGYLGIFFLIAVENLFPPIPSEVILTFGGFMTTKSAMNIPMVIISSTAGAIVGALCLYAVGRFIPSQKIISFVEGKGGKILRVTPEDIYKSSNWMKEKGKIAVFICRFIPLIRSLISIPAGMAKMNMFFFVVYTLAGTVIWNTVLILVGAKVGSNWDSFVRRFDKFGSIIFAVFAIAIIGYVIFKKKNSSKKEEDNGKS